jgi:ubiquinone/menaquinone biosynthesis C-methylase UbiE
MVVENFLDKYTISGSVFVTILNLRALNDESMKVARKKRYKFIQGNALSLPFADKSFDVVFSN